MGPGLSRVQVYRVKGIDVGVVDPRQNKFLPMWDCIMILGLGYTATVTPYEVAFLPEADVLNEGPGFLWILNRFVDLIFCLDIALTCNTMYEEPVAAGSGFWVGRRRQICRRYISSPWCIIDLISIFPFFLFSMQKSRSGEDDSGGGGASVFAAIRLVKLLRMLKLARVLKAADKLQPIIDDVVMTRFEFTYSKIKIVVLLCQIILFTHLMACFWAIASGFTDDGNKRTWISVFSARHEEAEGVPPTPSDVYAAALYWSSMTVTSIGYGEMLPENSAERIVCSIFMLLSGMVWTYALSTGAGVAATLNPNATLYQNTMDQLNYFMKERSLPKDMRRDLREFFTNARRVREVSDDSNLLQAMSPLLQGTVAYAANRLWLQRVWYLSLLDGSRNSREFVAYLAKNLNVNAFIAQERPPLGQLYVLRRGMVVKNWRFMRAGKVWGEDMIIDALQLMDHAQAVALTYLEVFTLSRETMDSACEIFPDAGQIIARAALRIRLQRGLLLYFCKLANTWPRSFIPQKRAGGYFFVASQMSLEQKVGVLHSAYVDDGEFHLSAAAHQSPGKKNGEIARLSQLLRMVNTPLKAPDPNETLVAREAASAPAAANAEGGDAMAKKDPAPPPGDAAPSQSLGVVARAADEINGLKESIAVLADRMDAMGEAQGKQHALMLGALEVATMRLGSSGRFRAGREAAIVARREPGDEDDPAPLSTGASKSRPAMARVPTGGWAAGGADVTEGAEGVSAARAAAAPDPTRVEAALDA